MVPPLTVSPSPVVGAATFVLVGPQSHMVGRCTGPPGSWRSWRRFLAMPLSGGERNAHLMRLIADFEAAGDAAPVSAG